MLSKGDKELEIKATKVELGEVEELKKPKDGKKVTEEEFEKINAASSVEGTDVEICTPLKYYGPTQICIQNYDLNCAFTYDCVVCPKHRGKEPSGV